MDLDPRRFFTRAEVWRAWELQGQVCRHCRRRIPFDLLHGDHIVPWAAGGPTTMANLQAPCGSCNLRKGSQPQEAAEAYLDAGLMRAGSGALRRWQAEALQIVLDTVGREPVLVEACPGAGKTQFGLEVAYQLVVTRRITRVLVVVPTLAIADGWQRSASVSTPGAPTLPLRSQRDWRAVDPIGDGWAGAVLTYQSLFASAEMFLAHATDPGHRTLVIFDEVHHAGARAAWGRAAQEAFAAGAAGMLSLSGTPFRTGRDPIVFVPSEGGAPGRISGIPMIGSFVNGPAVRSSSWKPAARPSSGTLTAGSIAPRSMSICRCRGNVKGSGRRWSGSVPGRSPGR